MRGFPALVRHMLFEFFGCVKSVSAEFCKVCFAQNACYLCREAAHYKRASTASDRLLGARVFTLCAFVYPAVAARSSSLTISGKSFIRSKVSWAY